MIKRLAILALAACGMAASMVGPVNAQQNLGATSANANTIGLSLSAVSIGGGNGSGSGASALPAIPVASAVAPGLALMPGSTCVLAHTASGGLQFLTVGASAGFGTTKPYEECNIQYNIRMLYSTSPTTMVVVQDANGQNVRINAWTLAGYMVGQLTGVSAAIKAYQADRAAGIPAMPVAAPMPPQQGGAAKQTTTAANDNPEGMVWKCYNPRDQSSCGYVPAGS